MPLKLTAPIYEEITLKRADEKYGNDGEPTTVVVKQARQHEHERRMALFAKNQQKYGANPETSEEEVIFLSELSWEEVFRLEAWLTLCESNITKPDGEALFPSKKGPDGYSQLTMTRGQFDTAWGSLFPDIAYEIIEAIHKVNPLWGGPTGKAR